MSRKLPTDKNKDRFTFGGRSMFVVIFWILSILYFLTQMQIWLNTLLVFIGIKFINDWFGN